MVGDQRTDSGATGVDQRDDQRLPAELLQLERTAAVIAQDMCRGRIADRGLAFLERDLCVELFCLSRPPSDKQRQRDRKWSQDAHATDRPVEDHAEAEKRELQQRGPEGSHRGASVVPPHQPPTLLHEIHAPDPGEEPVDRPHAVEERAKREQHQHQHMAEDHRPPDRVLGHHRQHRDAGAAVVLALRRRQRPEMRRRPEEQRGGEQDRYRTDHWAIWV